MSGYALAINLRHIWKNKLYAAINIVGLGAGISCMILAVLYWKDERSFDSFHKNNPNLYRITTTLIEKKEADRQETGGTGQLQGPVFKAGVPEIADFTRVMGGGIAGDVAANGKVLRLKLLFADENFFSVFSFPLSRGNPETVLKDVSAVVITESTAMRYFNSIDVVGRQLQMDADPSARLLGKPLVVSGVVKDPPGNSSIRFDMLLSLKFMQLSFEDNSWLTAYLGTYVVLRPQADRKMVARKFDALYAVQAKQQIDETRKRYGFDPQVHYGLQSMTDIHLNPMEDGVNTEESGISNGSNPRYAYMFMGIALFILTMAGINFINISLADALTRAKAVAVRKVLGGSRFRIIRQFLGESAVLCSLAFGLGLIIARVLLPLFNTLTGKQISIRESLDASLFFSLICMLLFIILFTGLYPARVLSNFRPAEVLYKRQKLSGRSLWGRGLVVMEFTLAVLMLIATLVYYDQMNYIRTKDLGYNPDQVIRTAIEGDRDIKPLYEYFRNELKKESAVDLVSFGGDRSGRSEVKLNDRSIQAVHKVIDGNYLQLLQIPILTGRNFSSSFPADETHSAIVNEAFVRAAGLNHPIGTTVQTDAYFDKEPAAAPRTIVGVVKDFHFGSLREPIQPMIMFMSNWYGGSIWIKFQKTRQKEALDAVQKLYTKILPGAVYQFHFLDELNAKEYVQENRWQKIIRIATLLAMMICAMGLFGLAHMSTGQRIKEIGVRKVLGASARQIVALLAGDFLKLVMIAFVIAAPIAWIVMNKWLQQFAYRISMNAAVFILSGLIAITLAFIAVSIQSVRASMANPAESLKTE